jgi:hypothetical protein
MTSFRSNIWLHLLPIFWFLPESSNYKSKLVFHWCHISWFLYLSNLCVKSINSIIHSILWSCFRVHRKKSIMHILQSVVSRKAMWLQRQETKFRIILIKRANLCMKHKLAWFPLLCLFASTHASLSTLLQRVKCLQGYIVPWIVTHCVEIITFNLFYCSCNQLHVIMLFI